MADLIPTEIWFHHIFPKLRLKSVLRCKCVCRAWNGVLSDPEFVRTHLLHQPQHVYLKLSKDGSYFVDYEADDITRTLTAHAVKVNLNNPVVGSSNGLLCAHVKYKNSHGRTDHDLAILNPSTGDFKLIPKGPPDYPSSFGFYYDPFVNDGYIVCIGSTNRFQPDPLMKSKVYIYSIKSNSWKIVKKIDAPFSLDGVKPVRVGCGVDGSIYWLVNNLLCDPRFLDILVFNIKDNKFRKVQLPRGLGTFEESLTVFGSSIGVYGFSSDKGVLVVWTLKEGESEEWIKLMDLDVSFLNPKADTLLQPLCLTRNQKVLVLYCNGPHNSKSKTRFLLYDPVSKKREDLRILGISDGFPIIRVPYVESLVSLKSISRDDRFTVETSADSSDMIHEKKHEQM